jgi:hypothetical protein
MDLFLATAVIQAGVDANQFNGYLLLGYSIMGLIALVYIGSLYLRQRNLRRDMELMKRILQEDDETGS